MKRFKKWLLSGLSVCLLAGSLAGCGFRNTEFVLTTGLKGDQLFKVGSSVCTLPEAMVYVQNFQSQYENTYGAEMWNHDFGGITLEEYVKETVVSQLASIKAVTLLAKEYEVTLSDTEKQQVEKAAAEYFQALSEEDIAYLELEKKDVENLYRDHVLANKVYREITKDVNTEVSDDEARIITVQQILLDSRENAESVRAKLDEGREFVSLASAYSKDSQITCTFGRGEKGGAYEEAAFNLEKDEVSDIIETEEGYYLLKCTENFDRDATEANKVTMVEKRRDSIFQEVYDNLIANTPSEFNTRRWNKIHFSEYTGSTAKSFFEIYNAYFGE